MDEADVWLSTETRSLCENSHAEASRNVTVPCVSVAQSTEGHPPEERPWL